MKIWKKKQKVHVAALLIGSSVLLSRFMGLIRDKIISYWFGASAESDIYFTAFVVPDFINYLLAGAYFSITLIPLLNNLFQEDEDDGWRFFSCASLWVGISIVVLTLAFEAFLPYITHYIAPGFTEDATEKLVFFIRIILPAQIFFLVGACFNALLYLRKQFIIPSIAPLIYNGFIITFGILLRHRGMVGFCWGVLFGAFFGNLCLPLVAAFKGGGVRFYLCLKHKQMKQFIRMALPLMLGQSIVVLDEQLIRIFGSLAGCGTISHLNYARRLMLVPVGVVAQAAGVASYPFLAELYVTKNLVSFYQLLNKALKNTLIVIMPIATMMIISAESIVGLIFQQGRFLLEDTISTAFVLRIFLLAVPVWGFQQILGRGFYATKDTISPVVIGTITTVISLPIYFYGARFFGGSGIALASVLGVSLYSLILSFWWVKQNNRSLTFQSLIRTVSRCLLVCTVSSLVALGGWEVFKSLFVDFSLMLRHLIECFFKAALFFVVWVTLGFRFFKSEILEVLPGPFKKLL